MKHFLFIILLIWAFVPSFAGYIVTGGAGIPLLAEDNKNNHLQVYLLNGIDNATISFTSTGSETHQWFKYKESAMGATAISCVQTGNSSYITDIEDGCGYFVGLPTVPSTEYIWIIDYSRYLPLFYKIEYMEEEDRCQFLKIVADVEAKDLSYRTPLGAPAKLAREYNLTYRTQKWEEADRLFLSENINQPWGGEGVITEITIDAPLENTDFTLTGDQFAKHFGLELSMRTPLYEAVALEVYGFAETDNVKSSNELGNAGGGSAVLGGSAPITYTFSAYANEPVAAFYIWKIIYNPNSNTEETKVRYTDKTLRYTFEQEGIYSVQLEVIDSKSACTDNKTNFTVHIDSTQIEIPNFFSPGTSIGVNDEFKIAYTSLLTFKASIYNRMGNLLYQWTDPTKGWDGRVNGKFVPTGAYVVIVEYTDVFGKKKSKSRTLNILRAKQ